MKPNRKDYPAPASTKETASIVTATPPAPSEAHISRNQSDRKLHKLCENVTIIGWMGIIASATILLCSGLTIQWGNEIVRHFAYLLRKSVETERTRVILRRVVMMVSTSVYFLSAVNVLMNMFLLFGVVKLKYKLLLPWLLFHGFLFGLLVHISLYLTITSLLLDFRIFVILFASSTMMLMIFYKIAYEVFLLYRALRKDSSTFEEKPLVGVEKRQSTYLVLQSEA